MATDQTEGTAAPAAVPNTIHGVDVSSFQGAPAMWSREAGAIKWAAVKVTELQPGNVRYVNPDAAADWAFVAKQKLGRIAYLFGHPSVSATETVSFFQTEMKTLGLADTDGIMLDLEVTDGLQPARVSSWAGAVMANLKKTFHRTPILYTFISFAEAGNTAKLGGYPLWISDPSSPPGKPVVPAPWKRWTIHQYSTSGAIDRDLARFATVAAMEKAFGVKAVPPKPAKGDLGGTISGSVTAARWTNGSIVIAGLGEGGRVQVRRFDAATGKWGVWWDPAQNQAVGAPGLVAWGNGLGQLFYATAKGNVVELATEDFGKSWQ
ncbi:MAG TPA: GH25 family lysozyme [Streptosporangiaceae bacterium]|nr:GH25 family lysozyme [Streptosporangiaceae bacterium]